MKYCRSCFKIGRAKGYNNNNRNRTVSMTCRVATWHCGDLYIGGDG